MTIWQWAVCGCLFEHLDTSIRCGLRASYFYRRGESVPKMSEKDVWAMLLGISSAGLMFALFGYLWNL